jgi:type III secretion protein V
MMPFIKPGLINFRSTQVRKAAGFKRLGKHFDLVLVALIVAVIALMVLPLPPYLLDVLIASNLTISISLLMVSLYIGSPLGLSTFPSLLLFTTLFRLSLNIASTRQILLHAYAGDVITTFGKMVVGGDVIIGMVVFLIIAVVQFIVIAKGSERVAEVAARFSLDAMPGKQMSIDADLRAGIISKEVARQRRQTLESESQLYGAMDGAMKFVKGDAIAGLVIAAVNILAGIAVGMLRKDMSLDVALNTYSVLAIGDALVSQIPSLFVSVASGVVITRVARTDSLKQIPLGNEIADQLRAHPKALMIAGGVILAMLLVPGFPKLPFLLLGLCVGAAGWYLTPRQRPGKHIADTPMPAIQRDGAEHVPVFLDNNDHNLTLPIVLQVYPGIDKDIDPIYLNKCLVRVRRFVTLQLGMPFPGMVIRPDARKQMGQFGLYVNEIPVLQGALMAGHVLCTDSPEALKKSGIRILSKGYLVDQEAQWVDQSEVPQLQARKHSYLDAEQILENYTLRAVVRFAHEFIGVQETQFLLKQLEQQYPDLEKELRQQIPLPRVADILRRLVQEDISIRDLRLIAQVLVEHAANETDNALLTEYVRNAMVRSISYQHTLSDGTLPALIIAPQFEERIAQHLRQDRNGAVLLLPEPIKQSILLQIKQFLSSSDLNTKQLTSTVVLVNTIEVRPHLRSLLVDRYPNLVVIAAPQLEGTVRVISIGQIE